MENQHGEPSTVFAANPTLRAFWKAEDGQKFDSLEMAESYCDRKELDPGEIEAYQRVKHEKK